MLTDKVMDLAIAYNGSDVKRINHLLKVFSFARHIGVMENCDTQTQTIIEIASLLHDIGIPVAIQKYNSSAGKWQEIEGPVVAKELLKDLDVDATILDRVLFLIGHHHTYTNIDGIDYQILVEADFLVNIFESASDRASINETRKNIFKTKTSIRLLEQMYMGS
ncbi:MAG: HD domain-containing protein [Treponema sp.]|nr:HD domain-containing protein [Treponema sp.]